MKHHVSVFLCSLTALFFFYSSAAYAGTNYWVSEGRVDIKHPGAALSCDVYSKQVVSCPECRVNDFVGAWCTLYDTSNDGRRAYMYFRVYEDPYHGGRLSKRHGWPVGDSGSVKTTNRFWISDISDAFYSSQVGLLVCTHPRNYDSGDCSSIVKLDIYPD